MAPESDEKDERRKQQRRLIYHGTMGTLIGCLAGFPYAGVVFRDHAAEWGINGASLVGDNASILAKILMSTPGTERAWKMAHLEGVLNGMLGLLIAANYPALNLSLIELETLTFHMIISVYGNAFGALVAAFREVRGLSLEGTVSNKLAALFFNAAIISLFRSIFLMIRGANSDKQ